MCEIPEWESGADQAFTQLRPFADANTMIIEKAPLPRVAVNNSSLIGS